MKVNKIFSGQLLETERTCLARWQSLQQIASKPEKVYTKWWSLNPGLSTMLRSRFGSVLNTHMFVKRSNNRPLWQVRTWNGWCLVQDQLPIWSCSYNIQNRPPAIEDQLIHFDVWLLTIHFIEPPSMISNLTFFLD